MLHGDFKSFLANARSHDVRFATLVEAAVHREARQRVPVNDFEREVRLQILALPVTQNGDDEEVEAFARELLAHAIALREGR